MDNSDSVSITVQNFLSRIEAEGEVGLPVQTALRRLAETSQLSNQDAIEAAIQEEDVTVGEAEATEGKGPQGSS